MDYFDYSNQSIILGITTFIFFTILLKFGIDKYFNYKIIDIYEDPNDINRELQIEKEKYTNEQIIAISIFLSFIITILVLFLYKKYLIYTGLNARLNEIFTPEYVNLT